MTEPNLSLANVELHGDVTWPIVGGLIAIVASCVIWIVGAVVTAKWAFGVVVSLARWLP